jgi:23S rRNA pseudouridine1911/1915/1917 synthase
VSEPRTVFGVGERDRGKRLDRFLHEHIPGISRSRIQRAIEERVTLSWGVAPRASTPVRPGGVVEVGYTPIAEEILDLPIPVIARGDGWLAVDKPSGIPVHPVNSVRENTLIRMLRRQEGIESLRLTHRLDRETTGVLLVAETVAAARALSTAFERGRVRKEYLAIVAGNLEGKEGMIDRPIGDAPGSKVFVRRAVVEGGQEAITRWRVERRLEGATLLRLFPVTGRRHQLRVHLEAIGHPILGDALYGKDDSDYLDLVAGTRDARVDRGEPRRQLLHCARLAVLEIDVEAPIPADFSI